MPIVGQLREARHRWYGNAVHEIVGVEQFRSIHPEEAAIYMFECDFLLKAVLPYDVTNECLGLFVRVINDDEAGGGSNIQILDVNLVEQAVVLPGWSAMIVLISITPATGTWLILQSPNAFTGRTPLS